MSVDNLLKDGKTLGSILWVLTSSSFKSALEVDMKCSVRINKNIYPKFRINATASTEKILRDSEVIKLYRSMQEIQG